MHCIYSILILIAFLAIPCHAAPPAPDLFAGYNEQISSQADAKATESYGVWASNMENLIRHNAKKGIIIEGPSDNDLYSSDGAGNVTIKEGASVGTVINNFDSTNSTIIIKKEDRRH